MSKFLHRLHCQQFYAVANVWNNTTANLQKKYIVLHTWCEKMCYMHEAHSVTEVKRQLQTACEPLIKVHNDQINTQTSSLNSLVLCFKFKPLSRIKYLIVVSILGLRPQTPCQTPAAVIACRIKSNLPLRNLGYVPVTVTSYQVNPTLTAVIRRLNLHSVCS